MQRLAAGSLSSLGRLCLGTTVLVAGLQPWGSGAQADESVSAFLGARSASLMTNGQASALSCPAYSEAGLANPLPTVVGVTTVGAVPGGLDVGPDGAARYTVALEPVPGPNGMAPLLSLSYNSRGGNGYLGVGFSLSGVDSITRCGRTLADDGVVEGVELSSQDRYCLSGLRLELVSGTYGGNGAVYRTNPDSFAKVISYNSEGSSGNALHHGPTAFEVRTASGLIRRFESIDRVGPYRTGWHLTKVSDRFTNTINYEYTLSESASTNPSMPGHNTTARRLDQITYGGNAVAGKQPDRRVKFTYKSNRSDDMLSYALGEPRIVSQLLERIEMQRRPEGGGEYVNARFYKLAYLTGGATGSSKLDSLQQCALETNCLPATKFDWYKGSAGFKAGVAQDVSGGIALSHTNQDLLVLDVDGDGADDIAYEQDNGSTHNWHVLRSTPANSKPYASKLGTPAQSGGWKIGKAWAIDYNLDGRDDILPFDNQGMAGAFPMPFTPILSLPTTAAGLINFQVETASFRGPLNGAGKTPGQNPQTYPTYSALVDMNGDGYNDALQYIGDASAAASLGRSVGWYVSLRTGKVNASWQGSNPSGQDTQAFGAPIDLPQLADITPSMMFLLDVDGDGKTEVVYQKASTDPELRALELHVNGLPATRAVPGLPSWLLTKERITLDINGDGLVDILTRMNSGGTKWALLMNRGRNFRVPESFDAIFPDYVTAERVLVADYNHDGRQDVLFGKVINGLIYGLHGARASGAAGYVVDEDVAIFVAPRSTLVNMAVLDADADGHDDLAYVDKSVSPNRLILHKSSSQLMPVDRLFTVHQGTVPVPTVEIHYASLSGNPDVYQRGNCDASQHNCTINASYVVSNVFRDSGVTQQDPASPSGIKHLLNRADYFYRNSITHKLTREWLGFAEQRVTFFSDDQAPVTTRNFYTNTEAGRDPRLVESWTFGATPNGGTWLERSVQSWGKRDTLVADNRTVKHSYVRKRESSSYEFAGNPSLETMTIAQLNGQAANRFRSQVDDEVLEVDKIIASNEQARADNYGNVTHQRSTAGANGKYQTETRIDFAPANTSEWLIARPTQTVVTRKNTACTGAGCTQTTTANVVMYASTSTGSPTTAPSVVERFSAGDPLGDAVSTLQYDKFGNATRVQTTGQVDEAGTMVTRDTCTTYDLDGVFAHAVRNSEGHTVRQRVDPLRGTLQIVVDANGRRLDTQYDTFGRVVKTQAPGNVSSQASYALEPYKGSTLVRVQNTDHTGALTETLLDRGGRPVVNRFKGFDGQMRYTEQAYTSMGLLAQWVERPVRVGSAIDAPVTATYDNRGRKLSQTEIAKFGSGTKTRTWSYDKLVVSYTNTRGFVTRREFGQAGELLTLFEAYGVPTEQVARAYDYDAALRLRSSQVVGRSGTQALFEYDSRGNPVSTQDPDRGLSSNVFNAFNELIRSQDANGRVTRSEYDLLGRPLTVTTVLELPGSTKTLSRQHYQYDIDPTGQDTEFGKVFRLEREDYVSLTPNGDEQTTRLDYAYDDLGRLQTETHTLPAIGSAPAATYTLRYMYDLKNRLDFIEYPLLPGQTSPVRVRNRYDGSQNGQLSGIEEVSINNAPLESLWSITSVNDANLPTHVRLGEMGVQRQYTIDGRLQLQKLFTSSVDSCASCPLSTSQYHYDNEGNLHSRQGGLDFDSEFFEYDALDRLKRSALGSPTGPGQSRVYDALGNIQSDTHRGTFEYGDANRPNRVTRTITAGVTKDYLYDSVGNQISRAGVTVVYNEMNMPARISHPGGTVQADFLYGADGQRVRKSTSAGVTDTIAGRFERQAKGAVVDFNLIVPGIAVLPYRQTSGRAVQRQPTKFLLGDFQGSTELVLSDDDPGAALKMVVKERRSYDAFGLARNPDWSSNSYAGVQPQQVNVGYTGHDDDAELGLINMKGRLYDPMLGRFLSADPLVSNPGATQPWNPYAYVRNNPLKYIDPSGFAECLSEMPDGSCMGSSGGGSTGGPYGWERFKDDATSGCGLKGACFDGQLDREVAGIERRVKEDINRYNEKIKKVQQPNPACSGTGASAKQGTACATGGATGAAAGQQPSISPGMTDAQADEICRKTYGCKEAEVTVIGPKVFNWIDTLELAWTLANFTKLSIPAPVEKRPEGLLEKAGYYLVKTLETTPFGGPVRGVSGRALHSGIPLIMGEAHSASAFARYKEILAVSEKANELVHSLRTTGRLPSNYVTKAQAIAAGWSPGKALGNYVRNGQMGGDVFHNTTGIVPSAPGRIWYEADIGLSSLSGRNKQPGTRLLYSNDGLHYVTDNHYTSAEPFGGY